MNAPSFDMAELLESSAAGLGFVAGTDLFVSAEPDAPDACVTLLDSPGFPPDTAVADYQKPGLNVRVRGVRGGYSTAYAVAASVLNYLHTLHGEIVNGTRYVAIFASTDVIPLGLDENGRPVFSLNFNIHRTPTS